MGINMKFVKACSLIVGASLFFPSCASIIHGTRQKVSVVTDPPGAIISDGETTLQTPAVFNLKRNRDYVLSISKQGYENQNVKIVHVISGVVAGNILAGGFIGWGVDAISGAQWRLEPETMEVTLRPVRPGEVVADSQRLTAANLDEKIKQVDVLKEKNLLTVNEHKAVQETLSSAVQAK